MTDRAGAPAPAAACTRPHGALPRATSWLLMALTALAAFVGTGLETGSRDAVGVTTSATDGSAAREAGPAPRGERLAPLPLPSVIAAASTTSSPTGPAPDLPPTGASAPAPEGSLARGGAAAPTYAARLLEGGSGRAPPVTTGT